MHDPFQELPSRLVVVASGVSRELQACLGLRRLAIQKDQSFVFGFTIAAPESQPFDFDSATYYLLDPSARIDYLTLFRIGQTMRANLFVFRSARDPWVREFIEEPDQHHIDLPAAHGTRQPLSMFAVRGPIGRRECHFSRPLFLIS